MKLLLSCAACITFIAGFAIAEQQATTAEGKVVVLKDNGTWQFVQAQVDKQAKPADGQTSPSTATAASTNANNQAVRQEEDEPQRTALVDVIRNDRNFDVRKARWNMTKEEVKKSENLKMLSDSRDLTEYKFTLLGLSSTIQYKFASNRLVGAEYLIEQDDVNPSRFYEDFKALRNFLRQLYNAPVSDEKNWTNDMYKGDEKNWGFAISLGFLNCRTSWQNATTKITLNQSGGNHMITTNVQYFIREPASHQ